MIRNGETMPFEIARGRHEIVLGIDWCSSPAVTFEAVHDNVVPFECGPAGGPFMAIFDIILRPKEYLRLERKVILKPIRL